MGRPENARQRIADSAPVPISAVESWRFPPDFGQDRQPMDPFDLVGDVLDDQYRIDECAGEGVLSVVYRGRHLGVDADVAVKCLNLPPTMDEALAAPVAEGFRQAVRLHYRLARGNLHIAQTIASGTTIVPRTGAVVPYMVREWFEGESLAANFTKRREEGCTGRTLEEVLDLFQGAADALRYAHSQGISHLALTPSNFFLTELPALASARTSLAPKDPKTGQPHRTLKVLDFGVGRTLDVTASDLRKSATPSPGLHLLTPAYASPEQLSAHIGVPGAASDVYVFALVLLEALSDRMVMDGKDTGQIVARALDRKLRPGPKQLPISLPPQVEAIFERALALDPGERFPDVGELWEELLHADVELTSSSRDPSLPPPNFEEEEPTAEMPMEMLEATRQARDPSGIHDWEPSSSATARIRGPSLFRRLRHWRTLGLKGKTAAEQAEREEGPISMPPAISVVPGPSSQPTPAVVPAPPRAPAIPSWHPAPMQPGQKPHRIGSAPDASQATRSTSPPAASAVAAAEGAALDAPAPKPVEPAKPVPPKAEVKAAPPPKAEVKAPPPPRADPKIPAPKVEAKKPEPPKVEAPKIEAPKIEAPKIEAPKIEAPKIEAKKPEPPKVEPKKPEPPKPAPPKPALPSGALPPAPKRQPTLLMFKHGVDETAAARTSSPSSPAMTAAPSEPAPPPPAATAPAAVAAPPALPSTAPAPPAPAVATPSAAPPPEPTEPPKPLPPPPPADVFSALQGMEAAPVPVPPAAPSSSPDKKKDAPGMIATPLPAPVEVPSPFAPPPLAPPPPPPPTAAPSDPLAAMGPPSARSAPTEVTRHPNVGQPPFAPAAPQSETVVTDMNPRRRRGVIAAIVSFAVVLTIGIGVVIKLAASGRTPVDALPPSATTTTSATAPSATSSASAAPSASSIASVVPSASVAPVPSATSSAPKLPTQPKFYKNLATKALDKVAKDLRDCRDKKGRWGQSAATVNFLNDGTVKDVYIASPYTGTTQGKCVEDKIRTAQMAPFQGKAYPVVYYFVIPP
jgi:serine/threonine-protein kinase